METDADRLAFVTQPGGQLIIHAEGSFWALFDPPFAASPDGAVESRQPVLTARTLDVKDLPKDVVLDVAGEMYRIKRHEPDGSGMTTLVLKR